LAELQNDMRQAIKMKLLSRGINPSSLSDIDLDQFSSDDDSRYEKEKKKSFIKIIFILVMMVDLILQLMMVYQNI
jgi:hypothetical protein